jgi:hypothetical protein
MQMGLPRAGSQLVQMLLGRHQKPLPHQLLP